jgi:hypothetical protein
MSTTCPFPTSWADVRDTLRDAGGQPGTGVHAVRIGPFAAVDLLGTIVVSVLLWWYFAPRCWSVLWMAVFVLAVLALSVPVHAALGIDTAAVKMARRWLGRSQHLSSQYTTSGGDGGGPVGRFSSSSSSSSSRLSATNSATSQVSGPGRDVDSYPLDVDQWRASPVDPSVQEFSSI